MADVPLHVVSDHSSSERRITPSWSISQLKSKMETVTGIRPRLNASPFRPPPGSKSTSPPANEDTALLSAFPLSPYAEMRIHDTRPAAARINLNDTSGVDKYEMPVEEYERKTDSVLAWKKAEKLGRFNPDAPSIEKAKLDASYQEVQSKGIEVGRRCRVGADDGRRGEVRFVGEVPEIAGTIGAWVGVQLDEPVGKNDGSIGGTRYWGAQEGSSLKHGVFVRPERVDVGDYPVLDDLEDMEEI